jgi:hypothetical protein
MPKKLSRSIFIDDCNAIEARKNKPLMISKFFTTGGNILNPVGLNCSIVTIS